jgi:hypothetical protein
VKEKDDGFAKKFANPLCDYIPMKYKFSFIKIVLVKSDEDSGRVYFKYSLLFNVSTIPIIIWVVVFSLYNAIMQLSLFTYIPLINNP